MLLYTPLFLQYKNIIAPKPLNSINLRADLSTVLLDYVTGCNDTLFHIPSNQLLITNTMQYYSQAVEWSDKGARDPLTP